jgi:hypothetical protein
MNKAMRTNRISFHCEISIQISAETTNPMKIAIPPIEGVIFLWIFLRPGISTRFFSREYLMITGMIKKQMTKDVTAAASCIAILLESGKTTD